MKPIETAACMMFPNVKIFSNEAKEAHNLDLLHDEELPAIFAIS